MSELKLKCDMHEQIKKILNEAYTEFVEKIWR